MTDAMELALYFLKEVFKAITTTDSPFMFVYGLGILVAIISIFINLTSIRERGRY